MTDRRSIFEDVAQQAPLPMAPTGRLIDMPTDRGRVVVRLWLAILFALVVIMILDRRSQQIIHHNKWSEVL